MSQIKLTIEYLQIFDSDVFLIEGYNNCVCIYTPQQYKDLIKEMEMNTSNHVTYPMFKMFHDRGIYKAKIKMNGILETPLQLQKVLGPGELSITDKGKWIEIRYLHELSCTCSEYRCAKCVQGNCKDKNCNMHKSLS